MADITRNWGQITSGTDDLWLADNGDDSYSLGMSNTGPGDNIIVPWALVFNGTYPIKLVDNGDNSYLIGVSE